MNDAYLSSSSALKLDTRLIILFRLCLAWTLFLSMHAVDGLRVSLYRSADSLIGNLWYQLQPEGSHYEIIQCDISRYVVLADEE